MIVYRFENSEGKGPYRAGACGGLQVWDLNTHPSPYEEVWSWWKCDKHENHSYDMPGSSCMDDGAFGFISIEQAYWWFNSRSRGRLLEQGFKLVMYDSLKVFRASKQVIFEKKGATYLGEAQQEPQPAQEAGVEEERGRPESEPERQGQSQELSGLDMWTFGEGSSLRARMEERPSE